MSKQILVTGGLGFIGYHLCKQLLATDADVSLSIVDNLSSTRLNYKALEGHADIRIIDMRDMEEQPSRYEEIYHLASPVGSVGILKKNGFIAADIIELANKAARLAHRSGAKLLYLSSSEVYGRDGQHSEDSELIVPAKRGARMEYSLGKLTAEHILMNRAMDESFEIRIVRPFNVAGEWQSAHLGFVIPKFFEAAMQNAPLTVYGDGQQRRSFCHVSDLVKGVIAVQRQTTANRIYNVGNPDNITTIESLAKAIASVCSSASDIQFVDPYRLYGRRFIEAFDKIPDVSRLRESSDWQASVPLSQLLAHTQNFYKRRQNIATAVSLPA